MFIKHKRDGKAKAWHCANGRSQCEDMPKEEMDSPTMITDAMLLTACIDLIKRIDVATMDLPGTYLHAYNNKLLNMRLTGKLAELMVEVAPHIYQKYIIIDKERRDILFVVVQKVVYGTVKSALLFYLKLNADLLDLGLPSTTTTPVLQKMVNGKQMTIIWHVDDLKDLHVFPTKVTHFTKKAQKYTQ